MKIRTLSVLGVVGLASSIAHAQTDIPWIAGNGLWSNPANWMGGFVPNDPAERGVLSAPGTYTVNFDNTLTINGLLIPNPTATLQIDNARIAVFGGTSPIVDHAGPIFINTGVGSSASILQFSSSGVLQGTGPLILNATTNLDTAYIQTAGPVVITNAAGHTISGTGNVYGVIANDGVVNADIPSRVLQLWSAAKSNNGLMTATNGGTLQLGTIFTQSPSAIIRADADSFVNLNGATIIGGIIESIGSGIVQVIGSSTFNAGTFASGNLRIETGRILIVNTGLANNGTITVNPTAGASAAILQFNSSGALSGTGDLLLNASLNLDTAYLQTGGASVITNAATHLIHGTGNIYGALANDGVVNADVNGRTLQLFSAAKSNNNLLTATNGGTLQLGTTFTQSPSAVIRADAGSFVNLNGATINGGIIESIGSGIVQVIGSSAFNAGAFASGSLRIETGRILNVTGGLTNNGTVTVNPTAGSSAAIIQFNSTDTLAGTGDLLLNASPNLDTAYLQTSGPAVVTNAATHLIHGTGNIHGALANDGVVNADVNGRTLQLFSAAKSNSNLITATNGGILQISSSTLSQLPTAIVRADAGSFVNLSGATITGGNVDSVGSGLVQVTGNSTFNNVASVAGAFHINNGITLAVNGGFFHSGTMIVNPIAGSAGTLLQFNSSGSLGGTGDVLLNASPNLDTAYLQSSGGAVMTNSSAHLIHGTGNVYAALANDGVVNADASARTLQLLGAPKSNSNLLTATNGGILQINGHAVGQTSTGIIRANAGSFVNLTGATINGGNFESLGDGVVQATGNSVLNNVVNISGTFNINNGVSLTVTGGLTHTGTITVNPTAGGAGTLLQFNNSGSLAGPGTVLLNASPNLDTAYLQTFSSTMTNAPGHTIAGRGHIYANFVNNGIISPGNDAADRTNLIRRLGIYSSGPTAQVVIDLDGTVQGDTYDWLNATGSITLDGSLLVRLAPGYIPPANTVFTVVSGATRSGQFSTVTLPTLPPSLGYARLEYTNNAVRVRIPLCSTDWNAMDGINSQDFFDFLGDFFAGTADFNFDGFINSQDFFDFLLSFFGGCE